MRTHDPISNELSASKTQEQFLFSPDTHQLNVAVARKCGINAAIVFTYIFWWIKENHFNGTNRINNKTWMFHTMEQIQQRIDYMTVKEIRNAIDALLNQELIIKGYHHKNKFNRTAWYALADETFLTSNSLKRKYEVPDEANGTDQQGTSTVYTEVKEEVKEYIKPQATKSPSKSQKVIFSPNLSDEQTTSGKGKVSMTLDRWLKLCAEYGEAVVTIKAHEMSEWIIEGNKVNDCYLTLRRWIEKDKKQAEEKKDKPNWKHPVTCEGQDFRPVKLGDE